MGTWYIDLRHEAKGGFVQEADQVRVFRDLDPGDGYSNLAGLRSDLKGRKLVLAAHGFNVNADHGTVSLRGWDQLSALAGGDYQFVGVLWPGDSAILPGIDYPVEGNVALQSGRCLATFLQDSGLTRQARSLSFVSHSMGARVILETIKNLPATVTVEHLILMAGAIEDDCLSAEYAAIFKQHSNLQPDVVASRLDWVLEFAFPIGNPPGEIIMHGHPYFKRALGREGPETVTTAGQPCRVWQLPGSGVFDSGWNYGHLDYMPDAHLPTPIDDAADVSPPRVDQDKPTPNDDAGNDRWKSAYSAAIIESVLSR